MKKKLEKGLKLNKGSIAALNESELNNTRGGSVIVGGGCDITAYPAQCCTDANKLCPCPEKI